jgi:hypothetical protein
MQQQSDLSAPPPPREAGGRWEVGGRAVGQITQQRNARLVTRWLEYMLYVYSVCVITQRIRRHGNTKGPPVQNRFVKTSRRNGNASQSSLTAA